MIPEGEYFSDSHLRWNLGWPTPNYAGAFFAALLALMFFLTSTRWRWVCFAAESGGLFLLLKTYSRGAAVAFGAAWLFGAIASHGRRKPGEGFVWMARIGVLAVIMLAADFGWSRRGSERTAQSEYAAYHLGGANSQISAAIETSASETGGGAEDGSVANRLALWREGLKMIAAAPLAGWGAGESGRVYMNWFQDIDRSEGYATMVNSYLHVAVEDGLLILGVVLFGLVCLLILAWLGARIESNSPAVRALHVAAGASLLSWAVANVFTTLWIEPTLWIVPAIACFMLMWSARKNVAVRLAPLLVASFGITFFALCGLYGAGLWLRRSEALDVNPGSNGTIVVGSTGHVGVTWHVWPDTMVLGPTPGKELRRWLASEPRNTRLVVHRAVPLAQAEAQNKAAGVMLFGRQAERLRSALLPHYDELWVIHPLGVPPLRTDANSQASTTILLPEIDEVGNCVAWRRWAEEAGARVVVSVSCGLDIRSVWPLRLKGFTRPDK